MLQKIKAQWQQLQTRDQRILFFGGVFISVILFYSFVWQPWHNAIAHFDEVLPAKRINLVWMQQQAELVKNGGTQAAINVKGAEQSLLSIIEQTAKVNRLRKAIQKMSPGETAQEVRVVLAEADFNRWVGWVDTLFKQYAVQIKQVSVQKEDDLPNQAEIRVTFVRNI